MTLYAIFADLENYAYIGFNRDEMDEKFGANPRRHVDVSAKAKPYLATWKSVTVNFSDDCEGMTGTKIPDIMPFQGKLFLSQKAYDTLKALIEGDGEFLPVNYEQGQGYIFNPLSVAEKVDGLNATISHKNEYGDIDAMAFHEDRVKAFAIFKSEFDNYKSVICREDVKDAIENAGFGGVYFTLDLGNPFTSNMSSVTKTN